MVDRKTLMLVPCRCDRSRGAGTCPHRESISDFPCRHVVAQNYENALRTCNMASDTCGCVRRVRAGPASTVRCFLSRIGLTSPCGCGPCYRVVAAVRHCAWAVFGSCRPDGSPPVRGTPCGDPSQSRKPERDSGASHGFLCCLPPEGMRRLCYSCSSRHLRKRCGADPVVGPASRAPPIARMVARRPRGSIVLRDSVCGSVDGGPPAPVRPSRKMRPSLQRGKTAGVVPAALRGGHAIPASKRKLPG